MARSVDFAAQTTQAAGRYYTSGRDRHFRNPIGNLPHCGDKRAATAKEMDPAWSASECELRGEKGKDYRLLCTEAAQRHARGGRRLAKNAGMLRETGGAK